MTSRTGRILACILIVFAVVFGFVGLWVWALFGLSDDVGTAWFLTTWAAVCLAIVVAVGNIS